MPLTRAALLAVALTSVAAPPRSPAPAVAGVRADSADAALDRAVDALVRPLASSGRFAGVVLVAQGGRVRVERAYGMASVELGVPNTPATRFRLFSITKQFTAAAVLQLVARGQVDLDAPVRTYLPQLPAAWQGATVHQLLTHTSGIPNLDNAWGDSLEAHGAARLLDNLARVAPALARVPLAEAPGTKARYNNFGYELLACVVERASGRPFAEYLQAEVFRLAGMTGAGTDARAEVGGGVYVGSAVVPGLASGYNGAPGRLQVAAPKEFEQPGAGSVYATARDLWRYDEALTRGVVLPPAVERLRVARAVPVGPRAAYGYGWIVTRPGGVADTTPGAPYFVHHSGGTNGYLGEYARYPREGACVVVLMNRGDDGFADPAAIRAGIAALLFGPRYPAPRAR
jgi:CubicO group peptidase (beta-lactamase class C family)